MRPLKLKLTAFGPYKNTEEIDFADLQGNQLFVISGSTGSGKTTIFDGICFALYGSASGSDRSESRILRSDFAEDSTHTCVEMEFEIHNKIYRILRQIGHIKNGNKGATGERYEFFEKCEDGEKPCVERQIVSEINRRVEEIIGLTQNQFSQIVMLPQGEFRKLLTSETDNKEEILRKIFKTEPYKMISERLKQKKDAAAKAYQLEEQVLNSHIRSAGASLPERESELFEVMSREHFNVNQIVDGLKKEALFYTEKIGEDEQRYKTLYKQHDEQFNAYHEAKKWKDRFTELEAKEQRLEKLKEQLPSFQEKEQRVKHAERASFIVGIENLFNELQKNETEKFQLLEKAVQQEQKSKESAAKAEAAAAEEEGRQPEREESREKVMQLQHLLPQVQELDSKRLELERFEASAKQAGKRLHDAEKEHSKKKEEKEAVAGKVEELEKGLETYDEKQELLTGLGNKTRILKSYIDLQSAKFAQEKELEAKEAAFRKKDLAYKQQESLWFASQAHILAEQLHEGSACPVCGSLDHPAKSTAFQEQTVSKEELEAAKSELNTVDSEFRNAAAKLASLEEQLQGKKKELEADALAAENADSKYIELEDLKQQVDKQVRGLQSDKLELRKLKEGLAARNQQAEKLEQEKSALLVEVNEKKSAFDTAKALFEDKLLFIPEDMRLLSALEAKIKLALSRKQQLEQSWEAAQKNFHDAKEKLASAAVTLQHSKTTAKEISEKRERAEQQFAEALKKSDFESEAAYQQAKMKEADFAALKKEILDYNQSRHTLEQQVKELNELLSDRENEDLTQFEKILAELKKGYEQALAELNRSKDFKQKTADLIRDIDDVIEKAAEAERTLNRIADLHDMIRGQNSLKISFERYLQIEYLEQIILAANERLRNLSNGQFYLIRSDRQESRGKQSGLGLDVYDSYTGQTRDVKTLSGGEKFNASLCLALGMADVIQSFEGNVSIDTMFIDEGFGSLDEESLNKSIEVLIDLQKSGRMIGVISHVQELKAAIPAILEVKKSKEGFSQTKFLIK